MTPRERAKAIIEANKNFTFNRHNLADDIATTIEGALEEERQQRTISGAPLTEERLAEIRATVVALPVTGGWYVDAGSGLSIRADDATDLHPWDIATVYRSIGYGKLADEGSRAVAVFITDARSAVPALLAHVAFLEGPILDALGHGELEQYLRGRDAGLEEAAKMVDPTSVENGPEGLMFNDLARDIRALRRPTP